MREDIMHREISDTDTREAHLGGGGRMENALS
jgi:hypothetical protein